MSGPAGQPKNSSQSETTAFLKAIGHEKTIMAGVTALTLLMTLLVYRPDRDLPFDFVDFSEFLPLLQRGESFIGRVMDLLSYYAGQQGRLNLLVYVALAAKWEFWGDYSPAWQWLRFGMMWMVIVLTYHLLRRLGASRLASAAGTSMFLFAPPAVDGWIRLTMAEPLGTVILLVMCLLAMNANRGRSERRLLLTFAGLCVALVLLKEMLAATILLPLVLAAWGTSERRGVGSASRSKVRALAFLSLGAVLLAAVPVGLVAYTARADAYTADFGSSFRSAGDVLAQGTLGILPFAPGSSFPAPLAGLALLLLLALLVAGWTLQLRHDESSRRRSWRLLTIALLFPLLGAATYLPWPSYNRFYAIPYLLGGAIMAAIALSALEDRSRGAAIGAYGIWAVFLLFAGADAAAQSARAATRQRLSEQVVSRIAALGQRADTVFLATEQRPPTFWQGIGPTLQRYGEALGHTMPPVINVPCEESRRRARVGDVAVVVFSSLCPGSSAIDPIVARYRRLQLPFPHLVVDSIRVDFVVPDSASKVF
jgi:hypothetical protein